MTTRAIRRLVLLFPIATLTIVLPSHSWSRPLMPAWAENLALSHQQPEERGAGRIAFTQDPESYQRLFRSASARVIEFPLPGGQRVDLEVTSVDLVNGRTRFMMRGANGIQDKPAPSARFFRGEVAGDPDSLVSINLIQGHIAGFVRTGGREYSFGPRSFTGKNADDGVEVRDDSMEAGPAGSCEGFDEKGPVESGGDSKATRIMPGGGGAGALIGPEIPLVAPVAIEGTVEWVNRHGGVAEAEAYTLNLLAQVSAVYDNDINVTIEVPWMLMNAAEPDGYTGDSNSTATHLSEMRTKWNADTSLGQVYRSAAHLFGTYPSGGAGRAYLNVLCDGLGSNSYDYGVSLLQGAGGAWERRLVAHELGHNFSSPHSHCYTPEIDQCYNTESGCYSGPVVQSMGTVMSYCSTSMSIFHQREIDEKLRPGAVAAYPTCLSVGGSPGSVDGSQVGSALTVQEAAQCPSQVVMNDDGGNNGAYGYSGTTLASWVKRFTPGCYPFRLTDVDIQFGNASVAPGRTIRILVYTEPTGSGTPAAAMLAHAQDTVVQVTGMNQWNHYTLTAPVTIGSGDYYVGFQDLVADSTTTYIMDYDNSRNGDSFWQANGTGAADYNTFTAGTWLMRTDGEGMPEGSTVLTWGVPCNDAGVPGQDYAIYQGAIGDWTNLTNLTCTTGYATSWVIGGSPESVFWLVVPQTTANEGSYGWSSSGERAPAAFACRPQSIGSCEQ